jgi:hypothetical protein
MYGSHVKIVFCRTIFHENDFSRSVYCCLLQFAYFVFSRSVRERYFFVLFFCVISEYRLGRLGRRFRCMAAGDR